MCALQVKMAAYMQKAFGEALVTDFIDGNPHPVQLPSPKVSNGSFLLLVVARG